MPPSILYHYTSQDGLLGIIESKAIWASSIAHLNDASEFMYAHDVLRTQAEELKAAVSAEDAAGVDKFVTLATDFGPMETFVSSFSENGDLLSQWRGYCPIGAGYSLGFDFEFLNSLPDWSDGGLFQCIYDLDEQNTLVRGLLTEALSVYREDRGKTELTIGQHQVDLAYKSFYPLAPRLKHPSYSEEKEWRLIRRAHIHRFKSDISKTPPYLFCRKGKSMLIPYIVLRLPELYDKPIIRKIIVGPTSYPELSKQSVGAFMRHLGMENCEVVTKVDPFVKTQFGPKIRWKFLLSD